jgi:type IV fimbrial biogenesis protein FimT
MAGVSLIELVVVIAIGAILTGIGVSTYRNITVSYRMSSEINGLLGDMQYARSEAIKEGQNVVICVANSGATDCATGNTNWNQGWIVFADPTNGLKTNGTAPILRKQPAFPTSAAASDTLTDGLTWNVSFDREGLALSLLTTQSGAGGALITMHDAAANVTRTRCLQITNAGNLSVQQHSTLAACT